MIKDVIKKNNERFPNSVSATEVCDHFTNTAEKVTENNYSVSTGNEFEQYLTAEADVPFYPKPVTLTELKEVLASFSNSGSGIDLVASKAV